MREIKFRGKYLDGKGWAFGHLVKMWGAWHIIDWNDENTAYAVDPATVGQFTGIKDKYGERVYEGDVFHYVNEDGNDCISEVKYDDEDGCFNLTDSLYVYGVNYAIKRMNANLIGNIHDNPELLKTE